MRTALSNPEQYAAWVRAPAAGVYFLSPECGVCGVLLPRIEALLATRFPRLPLATLDAAALPEVAAQAGVFAFPALLVFLDGRECLRQVRSFSPAQVEQALARPYELWLGAEA